MTVRELVCPFGISLLPGKSILTEKIENVEKLDWGYDEFINIMPIAYER
jgi:hypothetical protein